MSDILVFTNFTTFVIVSQLSLICKTKYFSTVVVCFENFTNFDTQSKYWLYYRCISSFYQQLTRLSIFRVGVKISKVFCTAVCGQYLGKVHGKSLWPQVGTELEEGPTPAVAGLVVGEGAVAQVEIHHNSVFSDLSISSTSSYLFTPHSFITLYHQESRGLAVHQWTALQRPLSARNTATVSAVRIRWLLVPAQNMSTANAVCIRCYVVLHVLNLVAACGPEIWRDIA